MSRIGNRELVIPAGVTVEEFEKLKKENAELKTRRQCRNKHVCNKNGEGVPCYIFYGCLNCHYKTE